MTNSSKSYISVSITRNPKLKTIVDIGIATANRNNYLRTNDSYQRSCSFITHSSSSSSDDDDDDDNDNSNSNSNSNGTDTNTSPHQHQPPASSNPFAVSVPSTALYQSEMMSQGIRLTLHDILDYSRESNGIYKHGIEVLGQVLGRMFPQMAKNMNYLQSWVDENMRNENLSAGAGSGLLHQHNNKHVPTRKAAQPSLNSYPQRNQRLQEMMLQRRLTPQDILGYCRESNDVYKNMIAVIGRGNVAIDKMVTDAIDMVGQGNVAIDKMVNDMASSMSFLQKLLTPQDILGYSRESPDVYRNAIDVVGQVNVAIDKMLTDAIAMVGQGNSVINKIVNDMASNMSFLQTLRLTSHDIFDYSSESLDVYNNAIAVVRQGNFAIGKIVTYATAVINSINNNIASNKRFQQKLLTPQDILDYSSESLDVYRNAIDVVGQGNVAIPISSSDSYESKQPPTNRVKRNSNESSTAATAAAGFAVESKVESGGIICL